MDESLFKRIPWTRIRKFVRSLLPEDLSSFLFMLGFACLFIAPSLGWWPGELQRLRDSSVGGYDPQAYQSTLTWLGSVLLVTLPIRLAGAAALFTCFFPPRRLRRRLGYWIFLPVAISLAIVSAALVTLSWSRSSVLVSPSNFFWSGIRNAGQIFLRLGPGFNYTLVGLILVLFAWRAQRTPRPNGETPGSALSTIFRGVPNGAFVPQTLRYAWIVVIAPFLLGYVSRILNSAYLIFASAASIWVFKTLAYFGEGLYSLLFVGLVAWAVGEERRALFKRSFHKPPLTDLGLAILFPAAIVYLYPLFGYLADRIHWAAFDFGRLGPPLLSSYFNFPGIIPFWALIPALAEEIAWRGYLQPRFIRTYGLARGIFFTGIVWGAFHFAFDFGPLLSDQAIAVHLASRLFNAIALSVVLAWVTLRSGSVIPAAIIHGLYNILLAIGPQFPLAPWTTYAVWLLTGLALFRFWPPQGTGAADSSAPLKPASESASPDSTSGGLVS